MSKAPPLRLGVNVDHVATLRNARGGRHPDPVRAALTAIAAGADGITAHLREDRRHIRDDDMARLKAEIDKPLNFEMAATDEMLQTALKTAPHAVCLVPERRQEVTTEGGLDVAGQHNSLKPVIARLNDAGIRVSLFIAADPRQMRPLQARPAKRMLNLPESPRGPGSPARPVSKSTPGTVSTTAPPRRSLRCRRSWNSTSATS
jgi:pyridoxine 5-phosphate synthase